MNNIFLSILVIILFLLASCSSSEQEAHRTKITASAKATKYEDGTIKVTEPSERDTESLQAFSLKLKEINAKYPKPIVVSQKVREFRRVEKVLQNGTLRLKNGIIIGFAGCDCNDKFTEYLRRTFTDDSTQVYYLDTDYTDNEILYAYVWEIDVDFGDGIGTKEFPVGPSFSLLNEVGIINKWCRPVEQKGHLYHDRYIALSKVVRNF